MIDIECFLEVPNVPPVRGANVFQRANIMLTGHDTFDHADILLVIDDGHLDWEWKERVTRDVVNKIAGMLEDGDRLGFMNTNPDIACQWRETKGIEDIIDAMLEPAPESSLPVSRDVASTIRRVRHECKKWHDVTGDAGRILKVVFFTTGMDFTDFSTYQDRIQIECNEFKSDGMVVDMLVIVPVRFPIDDIIDPMIKHLSTPSRSNGMDSNLSGFLKRVHDATTFGVSFSFHPTVKIATIKTSDGDVTIKTGMMHVTRQPFIRLSIDHVPDGTDTFLLPEIIVSTGNRKNIIKNAAPFSLKDEINRLDVSFEVVETTIKKRVAEERLSWQETRLNETVVELEKVTKSEETVTTTVKTKFTAYTNFLDAMLEKMRTEVSIIDADIKIESMQSELEEQKKKKSKNVNMHA